MSIIIGIDPGSRITGYGVLEQQQQQIHCLHYGTIVTGQNELHTRIATIYEKLTAIFQEFQPQHTAVEQVFVKRNVQSALKLGQARGAALIVAAQFATELHEYSPRSIKLASVGHGGASKQQVQIMVKSLLKLDKKPTSDAADALAVAICHCHQSPWLDKLRQMQPKGDLI